MKLEGSIRTTGPADDVIRGLADEETLATIAPAGFEFRRVEDGVADFLIRRGFGPVNLTLQGSMALREVGEDYELEIKASHLIGGRVNVTLALKASSPDEEGLAGIGWAGELAAQGLAGRLLSERSSEGNRILRNLFLRLRDHVEGL
jgi:carbon monoxide dehydrogenase subunit G